MKHTFRKLSAVLLCLTLLLTAAAAAETVPENTVPATETAPENTAAPAEDATEGKDDAEIIQKIDMDVSFPYVTFTAEANQAIDYFKKQWAASNETAFSEISAKVIPLSNGKEYTEYAFTGTNSRNNVETEARLYAFNGRVVAGVQIISVPEGQTVEMLRDQMINSFGFGTPMPLTTEDVSAVQELLDPAVHFEDGQDLWHYTLRVPVAGSDQKTEIKAIITLRSDGDHVYLAEFPEKETNSGKPLDIKGFDQLTAEEQQEVRRYDEFLTMQKNEQLEKYVQFILNSHK